MWSDNERCLISECPSRYRPKQHEKRTGCNHGRHTIASGDSAPTLFPFRYVCCIRCFGLHCKTGHRAAQPQPKQRQPLTPKNTHAHTNTLTRECVCNALGSIGRASDGVGKASGMHWECTGEVFGRHREALGLHRGNIGKACGEGGV
jgi:hypothetical protein